MIRILHRHDLSRKTRIMEERLDGNGPWYLVEDGYESPEAGYVTGDTGRGEVTTKTYPTMFVQDR